MSVCEGLPRPSANSGAMGRGPHPEDERLFAPELESVLAGACADLSWLLSRGYGRKAALTLVGDRFQLSDRQRVAVGRCACADHDRAGRLGRQLPLADCPRLWVDGLNVLTTVETALCGGVLLLARDGCYRDMASFHGNYRMVEAAAEAARLTGQLLGPREVRWLLDRPVSNTGRLAALLRRSAAENGWNWTVDLVDDPDRELAEGVEVAATSDSGILDRARRWTNLARAVVDSLGLPLWRLDLSRDVEPCP